jgi:hypothetical protein
LPGQTLRRGEDQDSTQYEGADPADFHEHHGLNLSYRSVTVKSWQNEKRFLAVRSPIAHFSTRLSTSTKIIRETN